jgi:crossover junction endodeoxyribonuclease RuvC
VRIIGIDVGLRGGLSCIEFANWAAPQLIDCIDIPICGVGTRQRVDPIAIHDWIKTCQPVVHAYIERAQSYPKQGIASAFKYGAAYGVILATVALCDVPLSLIAPAAWKKYFRLRGGDKESARQKALELFPAGHALLARRKDHGRAESILIGLFGARL